MSTSAISLLRDFSDRLSPMVVKELRHGLRARIFTSMLTTFQVCMILIVGSGTLGIPQAVIGNLFWSIALISLLVALPVRGFAALSGELQAGTLDMLTLTSISSFRIVWGKWSALFSQSLLLAISLLPYMVARYHFGGVEIIQEAAALLIALMASALATAAFVAFSSQRSLILRLFTSAGILAALIPITVFLFILINESGGDEVVREFFALGVFEQSCIALGIPLLVIYGILTFLTMGASRIAPPSENHSTRKRILHITVISLLTGAGWIAAMESNTAPAFWLFIPALILVVLVGMDLLTEDMPHFPTVVQGFVRRGFLGKAAGRLLYPGWVSGIYLYTLLAAAVFSIIGFHVYEHSSLQSGSEEGFAITLCILLAPVVPILIRLNRSNRFANWWVVNVTLTGLGVLLLFLREIVSPELGFLGILTPITTFFGSFNNYRHDDEIFQYGSLITLCWLVAALVCALIQNKAYRDMEIDAEVLIAEETPKPADAA